MNRKSLKILKFIYKKRKSDIDVPMIFKRFRNINRTEIIDILYELKNSKLITSWSESAALPTNYPFVWMYLVHEDSHIEITKEGISVIELSQEKRMKTMSSIVKYGITTTIALLAIWVAWVTRKH